METGVVAVNRLRLRHLVRRKVPGAATLQAFLHAPDHLLGTTLVGTNLFNATASVAAVGLGAYLGGKPGYASAQVLITVLLLVFGEYLPKVWFQGRPASRTLPFVTLLKWNGYLFYPLSRLATGLARVLVPVKAPAAPGDRPFITVDELRHLTHQGEVTGTISRAERGMIERVLDLSETPCARIMVPHGNMVTVYEDTPMAEVLDRSRSEGFTRLPVIRRDDGHYVGVVNLFDLVAGNPSGEATAAERMRPPAFIPAAAPAGQALSRMRSARQPMMLVQGREDVVGLVTVEDVLKCIVGEI
jgi:putative hemolysin